MNDADQVESYEAPELILLGSFEDITLANTRGSNMDYHTALSQETHS